VTPLVKQLLIGLWKSRPKPLWRNLGGVETVAAMLCLLGDAIQERRDNGNRIVLSLKAR